MKIQELRQLTPKKLNEELLKRKRELAVVRFHVGTGKEQNTAKLKNLKKMVAQIQTLQRENELKILTQ